MAQNIPVDLDLKFMCSTSIIEDIDLSGDFGAFVVVDPNWRGQMRKPENFDVVEHLFATNQLILASKNKLDELTLERVIKRDEKIIIADKNKVPLGFYSYQLLDKQNLLSELSDNRIVTTSSANDALMLFKNSEPRFAILFASDAELVSDYRPLASELCSPIEYKFVVNSQSVHKEVLEKFFLSELMHEILKTHNFEPAMHTN